MPDIYGSAPISSPAPNTSSYIQTPQVDDNLPDITVPTGGDNTDNVDPAMAAFQNAIKRSQAPLRGWMASQAFESPIISTPVRDTERYRDTNIGFNAVDPNLEIKYGESHPVSGIFNRLLKTGAGVGVSIIQAGNDIYSALNGNTGVDNTVDSDLSDWLKRLDQVNLPTYQTQYQKEHPILSYFNPLHLESWLQNIGNATQQLAPMAGTIASALVVDSLLGEATGGQADRILLPKQLERIMAGMDDFAKGLTANEPEFNAFNKLLSSNADLNQGVRSALSQARRFNYGSDATRFITSNGLSSYLMSQMIANQTYNQVKEDILAQYKDQYGNPILTDEKRQEIEKTARSAGDAVFAPNFAFMAVSSAFGLSSILRPAEAATRAAGEALSKDVTVSLNKVNPNIFEVTPIQSKGTLGLFQKVFDKNGWIVDNMRQALTMGGFYVSGDATKNFYENKFNVPGTQDTMSLVDSYFKSAKKLFTTTEGQESLALGFLGGSLEHIAKGAYNRVRGIDTSNTAFAKTTADSLNSVTLTGLFDVSRQEAIASSTIAHDMQEAAATGDIFRYKNLQHEALFNFISSAEKVHQFDARINQLESLKTLSKDNFEALFNLEFNDSNRRTVGEYVDSVISKARDIQKDIRDVDGAFSKNPFNPKTDKDNYLAYNFYKDELAFNIGKQKDYLRRSRQIKEDIFSDIPAGGFEDITALSSDEGIRATINKFEAKIKDLKNSENLAGEDADLKKGFTSEREFLEGKINELNNHINVKDADAWIGTLNSLYNYFGNANSVNGDFSVDHLQTIRVHNNGRDVYRLLNAGKDVNKYYKSLVNKNGFEDFKAEALSKAYSYRDGIGVKADGTFFIKQDQSETPEDASKKIYGETPDVQSAIDKINAGDKEFIAKVIEPSYQATDDKESIGNKIVDGTQEITPEIKQQAIDLVTEDFKRQAEAAPSDETTRIKEQMKQMGVTTVIPGSSAAAVDEMYADQDAALEDAQTENEATQNIVTRLWKGLISPIKLLNKFYSSKRGGAESEDEILRKAIFDTNPELVQKDVIGKLRAEISESTDDPAKTKYQLITGSKGLYRVNNHKVYVRMYLGDKLVGFINDPASVVFRRGDKYLPISELADAAEYAEITGNDAKTFTQFKRSVDEFNKSYNDLTKDYNGTVTLVDNKRLTSLFDPNVSFGGKDTSLKEADSTLIKDLKYKGKGSAILSFPIEFNEQTRRWERTTKPNILNEDKLSDDEISDVLDFVDKKIKSFHDLDRRYFYLTKLPDGKFNDSSIIVARPANETEAGLTSAYGIIRSAVEGKSSPEEANQTLRNSLYLSDKNTGKSKEKGNQIRMGVDKDGNLSITFYNTHRKISGAPVVISKEDILNTNNFDELSSLISSRVEQVKKSDYNLGQRMRPVIEKTSFKKAILDDEAISSDQAESLLKASVKPNVFKDYTIELMPKVPEIPTATPAPAEATPVVAATPVSEATPVQDVIPDEEYNNFIDKGQVTPERVSTLATKVINREGLSPREIEVFTNKTAEVNTEIKNQAEANLPLKDKLINDNLDSVVSQLEQKGIAKKNC